MTVKYNAFDTPSDSTPLPDVKYTVDTTNNTISAEGTVAWPKFKKMIYGSAMPGKGSATAARMERVANAAKMEVGLDFVVEAIEPPFEARQSKIMLSYYPRENTVENYKASSTTLGTNYLNVRDLLARFFLTTYYEYERKNDWRDTCIGVTNLLTQNAEYDANQYVPMFDYDGKNVRKRIKADVKSLQKNWELGDAWVFGTKRGYHVYFFCDVVSRGAYMEMLGKTQCCKGFRALTKKRGYATLRVGAKYTKFDIQFLYILRAKERRLKKMTAWGHTILAIIELGNSCGTHVAALFPGQARFSEDQTDWRPPNHKKRKIGLAPPPNKRRVKELKKPLRQQVKFTNTDLSSQIYSTTDSDSYTSDSYTSDYYKEAVPQPRTRTVEEARAEDRARRGRYARAYSNSYPTPKGRKASKPESKPSDTVVREGCECITCRTNRAKMEHLKEMGPAGVDRMMSERKTVGEKIKQVEMAGAQMGSINNMTHDAAAAKIMGKIAEEGREGKKKGHKKAKSNPYVTKGDWYV